MTITIAGTTFDHHHYDARGDVLYLNVGEPRAEASGLETLMVTRSTMTRPAQ
jgi:hypothetical protein